MNIIDLLTPPSAEDREQKVFGVVVGIVTDNQDPDGGYRVKVSFPSFSADTQSTWARVATPMAGNNRGIYTLPEVDDEVLCAFAHGDLRFPYVIGSLWNGSDAPPRDNADGQNNQRVIRSRSGHELVFSDESGKEQIEIKSNAGHQILLDDTSGSEKISITDKSGNSIQIDSTQNAIAVEAQMKLSIKAQTIEIEAGSLMTIKAGATLTIQGALVKIN